MNIFLIILTVIFTIIFLLLFCPLVVKLTYNEQTELRIGYFFPLIKILPPKDKKEKNQVPEKNKEPQKDEPKKEQSDHAPKKNQSSSGKDTLKKVLDFAKKQGLDGIIELMKEVADMIIGFTKTIKNHLVISRLDLKVLVVGDDPADTAMKFGYACAALYPSTALIEENVKKCNHHIRVLAGFQDKETAIHLILKIRILPIFIIATALSALIKSVKIYLRFNKQ